MGSREFFSFSFLICSNSALFFTGMKIEVDVYIYLIPIEFYDKTLDFSSSCIVRRHRGRGVLS